MVVSWIQPLKKRLRIIAKRITKRVLIYIPKTSSPAVVQALLLVYPTLMAVDVLSATIVVLPFTVSTF